MSPHLKLSSVFILVTSSAVFRLVDASNFPFPENVYPVAPSFRINSNFRRAIFPDINRYVSHKAFIGRKLLQEDIQFLHKTVGSRHMEMLKVNLSDGVDPQTYSNKDLLRELRWIQMRLRESFPKLCNLMVNLTKEAPCATSQNHISLSSSQDIGNPLSESEWIDIKTFAAMLVYGEQMLKQEKVMET
ncbi:uncharacterized protein LOC134189309 [Corticium candelabrum]|uniref:uncharacterized protein LOC134189309 n=1 Tax=Corticium candelabrum TaxID=121492 RepID=UPI002E264262|nr:uncharacterized protein LOC134189309 [Corticium candelabrum]